MPLYYQIAKQLEEAIDQQILPAGERLANEVELAERLAVSRPTLRQAIDRLVEQGLVVRRRGLGTVVVPRRVSRSVALSSLYDDLSAAGRRPTTKVLNVGERRADEAVAKALGVQPGDPVAFLERLRYADGAPLAVMQNHLPLGLLDLADARLEQHGLYELLRARGIQLNVAHQVIGARPAAAGEAKLLQVARHVTVLTMTRTTYDSTGSSVEYGNHCYRADRYVFETSLVAR